MAATRIDGHKPLPRSESLQKMLDLEKQYKLARLQRTQTSTTPDTSAMSFQTQIRPPVPIQTRRRDSRESLYQQHQQHQQQLDEITTAVRRSGPASPLSITIPSPTDAGERGQLSQKSHRPSTRNMAADSDVKPPSAETSGDTTPREKSVEFSTQTKNGAHLEDDDEGSESDQSSICQSPSWEGYGQKKKSKEKKLKAETKKKEKERMDQELRAASKKRASNRLYKSPPLDSPDLNGHRPSSSASSRLDSSHGLSTKSGRFTPSSNQGLIPEVWGMAMGTGLSIPKSRPGYPRSQSAAGSYNDPATTSHGPPVTMKQIQQQNASGNRTSATVDERPTSSGDKVSYPPTSSRSHALRSILPTSHSRQNSASTITPVPSKPEDLPANTNTNGHRMYSTKNMSDQSLNSTSEKVERGRQLVDPAGAGGGSYVRKARAQSIERSIKGFMQEAALSDPNLLNGPNRTQFAYLGAPPPQQQQQPHSNGHRPSSSQSRITKPLGIANGVNGVNGSKGTSASAAEQEKQSRQQPQPQPQQPSRPQHQHPLKQHQPPRQSILQKQQDASPPVSDKAKAQSPEKDGDSSTDYINFVSKPYSPPSLELATPTSGIFSSIKSRIGRRSSTSSGSTSNTNTGKSFKERAMGAIHLQAHSNINSVATVIPTSQPPSRMHSQNSIQTAASSIVSSTKNDSSSSSASGSGSGSHSLQIPQRDTRRLPKPARVLGEINQETMSQGAPARSRPSEGSSTSSYHDDSSIPPSPASTPDTSRPQSAKGLSATIEEIQIGSPDMFKASQEDLTVTKPQSGEKIQAATKEATAPPTDRSHANQESQPNRPASRTESVRDVTVDRPQSKGRLLDDLERPISRGRLLENIERPGSRTQVREGVKQARLNGHSDRSATDNQDEDIMLDSTPNLSEGLGILDEAWSQSTVTPDNDAQSFVTTLTNQKSGTSLKSQFGNLKEAALLAEVQNSLGVHPALINHEHEPAPPAYNHTLQEVDESEFLDGSNGVEEQLQPSPEKTLQRSSFRKAEKRTSKQAKHMSVVSEEPRLADDHGHDQRASSPTPMGSDPRKTSIDVSFLPPLRHEAFIPPKSKARGSTSPPKHADHEAQAVPQQDTAALVSPAPTAAAAPEQAPPSASGRSSPSAMYLQEARRSAPLVSSPLSNVIRTAKANMSTPSLARPPLKTSASFTSGQHLAHPATTFLPAPPAPTSSSNGGTSHSPHSSKSPTSPRFRIPAHEPEQLAKQTPQSKPMAKMLVECCNCKFFHDMPSRVYECMAQPDAVVTDRDLGVSGAITTMVKCPWCSHNMSTQCCAGYAAVVYLKERLH